MIKNIFFTVFFCFFFFQAAFSQKHNRLMGPHPKTYTHADSLRGQIGPGRSWWDLACYHIAVEIDPVSQSISGSNDISYRVLSPGKIMQIDLQEPMLLDSVVQDGQHLEVRRDGFAWFLKVAPKKTGSLQKLTAWFHGKPRVAVRPPWDGGFTWQKDAAGKPWIGLSCQGIGASVWFPCKDHQYDEPDSVELAVTVPAGLMDVSGGRLRRHTKLASGKETFSWFMSVPINNYDISINVADYAHFSGMHKGPAANLSQDYYVLRENLEAARSQFRQADQMLDCFEHWFGPYPFYADGYKLVQTPFLGMEHQTAVAYGNEFKDGYLGRDLSGTGQGLDWDYIIIHESAHEWWGNNITSKDIADMWVHEAFATYSEGLFVECKRGEAAGAEYIRGLRKQIENKSPIVGVAGVSQEGSEDMYFKGANLLHTLRQICNNDSLWHHTLQGLNKQFYHETVSGQDIRRYISKSTGKNLERVFEQYLDQVQIPVFEYKETASSLSYRWTGVVTGFDMPLKIHAGNEAIWLKPASDWKSLPWKQGRQIITPDPDFYIRIKKS